MPFMIFCASKFKNIEPGTRLLGLNKASGRTQRTISATMRDRLRPNLSRLRKCNGKGVLL